MVKNPHPIQETWEFRVQSLGQEVRNGNPLQHSCLKNPMDRGACWATVHRVTKSQTRLSKTKLGTAQHRGIIAGRAEDPVRLGEHQGW